MKSTGMVRQIDTLGRIAMPKKLCKVFNISSKDSIEIYPEGDKLILQKYLPGCVICGSADNIVYFSGKRLCAECVKKLKSMK